MRILKASSITVVCVCSVAFACLGDDAAGVGKVEVGTNGVAAAAMPFASFGAGLPADFISGNFMGDGGAFSDRLYVRRAASGEITNAVYSSGEWLDPATLTNTTMTASIGDTLFLTRADTDPLAFFTFGRVPGVAAHLGFPRFSSVSVAPDGLSNFAEFQKRGKGRENKGGPRSPLLSLRVGLCTAQTTDKRRVLVAAESKTT